MSTIEEDAEATMRTLRGRHYADNPEKYDYDAARDVYVFRGPPSWEVTGEIALTAYEEAS